MKNKWVTQKRFACSAPWQVSAQSAEEIQGTVLDNLTQTSLPGVNVIVKGTDKGTVPDMVLRNIRHIKMT